MVEYIVAEIPGSFADLIDDFGQYVHEIFGETLYTPGTYGYKCFEDDYKVVFAVPGDKEYVDVMLEYLGNIFMMFYDTRFRRPDPDDDYDIDISMDDMFTDHNENKGRFRFDTYVKPLIDYFYHDYGERIGFKGDYWLDYWRYAKDHDGVSGDSQYGYNKWQMFFGTHVYKYYVFFKLADYYEKMFPPTADSDRTDKSIAFKIDLWIWRTVQGKFNQDILCFYVQSDDVTGEEDPGERYVVNTDEMIAALKAIDFDFSELRIQKLLFRKTEMTEMNIEHDFGFVEDEDRAKEIHMEKIKRVDLYNDTLTPHQNVQNLRTTFIAEIDSNYVMTKDKYSFYYDHDKSLDFNFILGGHSPFPWWIWLIIGVIVIVVIAVVVSVVKNKSETFRQRTVQ